MIAVERSALNHVATWWRNYSARLFRLDARIARDFRPFFTAIAYLRGEFIGAVANYVRAQIEETLLHVGLLERNHNFRV
jgi:hypothetical protein